MNHHAQLVRTADIYSYHHPAANSALVTTTADKIGIGEVRDIIAQANLRPANDAGQTFVIATSFITHEAQNALLKLFEEPPTGTSFVLVLPPAFRILPTLLSRIGRETVLQVAGTNQAFTLFVAASYADRLQQVDSWNKSKDAQWLTEITQGVHHMSLTRGDTQMLRALEFIGTHLQTRGASNKMLLEHLALVLPLQN